MKDLKPVEIVAELDKYIIGQDAAKRSVAIALRNRWRRRQVPDSLKDEIAPKNIILIGPTGVGKTEIARRLSSLSDSPFYKVEASKFTEVGYVGRDVESMVRDLLELTVNKVRSEQQETVKERAYQIAEERMLDLLLPKADNKGPETAGEGGLEVVTSPSDTTSSTREKLRKMLKAGKLDSRYVDLDVAERGMPMVEIFSNVGMEEMGINFKDMLGPLMPKNTRRRKIKVPEAMKVMVADEAQNLVDMDKAVRDAVTKVEQAGIIFLDEIDKIAGNGKGHGPDVSREGVQRDLLPIVEGSTVNTKYGPVKTDHILFIASGAFHTIKPSDLIPELQGRFPIRVNLHALGEEEFFRILTEPKNALVRQYMALMKTEGIELTIEEDAIREMARIAVQVNRKTEDIGARRLHTVMERVLDELSFDASERDDHVFTVTAEYVRSQLADISDNEDLSRYIL